MIYVILGMHKSGTTLISQILHHSGISMVDETDKELGYDKGNKYERTSTKEINHQLLGSEGEFSLKVTSANALVASPDQRRKMQELTTSFNAKHADWGFKDPRTCVTYPLWSSVLPEHRLIVVYRSPREVWEHYRRSSTKNRFSITLNPLSAWCDYNGLILHYLRQTTMRFVVLNYEQFMTSQAEFDRLQNFIARPINDQREKKLYRSKPAHSPIGEALWLLNRVQTGDAAIRINKQLEAYRK